MSHKVSIPNSGKGIDALMNTAIAKVPDQYALGEIKTGRHYHYTSMEMLLRHLRFITDADDAPVTVPKSIIVQYPAAVFAAFKPYWGSTRDSFLSIELQKQADIDQIPAVASFLGTLNEMCGDPSSQCSGTIRYHFYRKQSLAEIKASLAPQLLVAKSNDQDNEIALNQLERMLHYWANEELWNNQEYQQLNRQSKEAELPLAGFYRKRLGFTQARAIECAKAALAFISKEYLGECAYSTTNENSATLAYQTFSTPNMSLSDMERQLAGKTLTEEELPQALRLAILNRADIKVIDWLIKQGAPVTAGREPPLFTAVLRPEVVSALLKAGADVNETNPIGKTALIQAAQYNAGDTIKILIEAGADVKHSMVSADCKEATDANTSCDFNYTIGSRTPLMYATAFSDYPTITYLLSKGADKSTADSNGDTAVKYLSWNKRLSKADRNRLVHTLSR